ncbi:hypothetical protein HD554DRAFT_2178452 [Boletus coccyginus]|nr:hypothetical protein HD554DRAFT_2178452 [Boletus coccyginus]
MSSRSTHSMYDETFEPSHPFFGSRWFHPTTLLPTQPHGPYYTITDYSYGGVVTFEVVKCMEAMGGNVKFPGLINIPPHIADRMYSLRMGWTGSMLDPRASLASNSLAYVVWKLSPPERLLELQPTSEKPHHRVDITGSLIDSECASVDVFYAIPLRGSKI